MLHVYACGLHVATINKQHPAADSYRPEEPWSLLYLSGRVDRFTTLTEARAEARKQWHSVAFRRT